MSFIGTAAAAASFFIPGGQTGAFATTAYAIGAGVDAYINAPDVIGPRLTDLTTQLNSYGAPRVRLWGTNRISGTIIWPRTIVATEHEHSESAKGGPEAKTFTYTLSYAIYLCEGEIAGVRRAWKNKKLVYDMTATNFGPTGDGSFGALRIYLGTETQTQDPLIQAADGVGPAYLGSAYVVIENDDVTEMGGRPNQWEFEVLGSAVSAAATPPQNLGVGGPAVFYEGLLWTVSGTNCYVYNPDSGALLYTIALPYSAESITSGGGLVWVGYKQTGFGTSALASGISPITFAIVDSTKYGYGGATTQLGTVVWNQALNRLYGFGNGGVGFGARWYNPSTLATGVSNITCPDYVYHSVEMPDLFRIAVAGRGNWLVIADTANDITLATVTNSAWGSTVPEHRIQYDGSRNCLYWVEGASTGVYKVDLSTYALTLLVSGVVPRGLHYNAQTDLLYVDAAGDLNVYSPDTGALVAAYAGYGVLTGFQYGRSVDPGSLTYYFVGELGSPPGAIYKVTIGDRIAPLQVALSTIVSDICVRADLLTSEIDVTALTDMVDGYKMAGQMTARSGIEALMPAYFFDAVESDWKIKFVKRGGAIAATIPIVDRAAHEDGSAMPDSLNSTRPFELELPYQADVAYIDVDADHQPGNQYERRTTKESSNKISVQLPIVMSGTKAKQVARVALYQPYLNQVFRWSTSRKYAYLEPTDPVYLPTDEVTYAARITRRRDQPNGVIEWEGQAEDPYVYTQPGTGAGVTGYLPQTIDTPDTTILVLIDGPLLVDEDDNAGFYVAMGGEL